MENEITKEILIDYFGNYNKFISKKKDKDGDNKNYSKMAGNIFAMVIIKYLNKIIKKNRLNLKVSCNNSYIRDNKYEWDILLLKKDAFDNGINIYDEEDVVAIIELKTANYFRKDTEKKLRDVKGTGKEEINKKKNELVEKDMKSYFTNIIKDVSDNIRYLYITSFQNSSYGNNLSLKKVINGLKNNGGKESVYMFLADSEYFEYDNKMVGDKRDKYLKDKNFEKFILDNFGDYVEKN